jgi:8-oxo-dGTP pyrophosphatase MutT (NUDIX family)
MKPAAAVAILHSGAPEEAVLLMRRAESATDPWSGHWSLPGGRAEAHDPDLVATALRELEEECGIELPRAALVHALPPAHARRRTPPFLLVAPFVFRVDTQLSATVDHDEAVDAVWLPLGVLRNPSRHSVRPVPGMPANLAFPAVLLEGHPLWGFTYRLLNEWLGLMEQPEVADGLAAAGEVLAFLLGEGLKLRSDWADGTAEVSGEIPKERLLAWLATPRHRVPQLNRVDVRPDVVSIAGLDYREYHIRATAPARG